VITGVYNVQALNYYTLIADQLLCKLIKKERALIYADFVKDVVPLSIGKEGSVVGATMERTCLVTTRPRQLTVGALRNLKAR
jgi:hypothetical protein